MHKIVCLGGMNRGDEFYLKEGENTFGRSEHNDVCVFDSKASREHCKIVATNDSYYLEDLGTTNGTRINNMFVSGKRELKVGDEIRIGSSIFQLSNESSENIEEQTESTVIRKQEKYEKLLQETAFQVSKTSALRKLKTDDGKPFSLE